MTILLRPEPLTKEAFAPFGDVIENAGAQPFEINQGTTERFYDLAHIEIGGHRPILSIFRSQPRPLPIAIKLMERHPWGSQAFMPLQPRDYLIVVAEGSEPPKPDTLRAFRATGTQGVNYARNVWHHPLLVLDPDSTFLVLDCGNDENNLEEYWLPALAEVSLDSSATAAEAASPKGGNLG